MGDRICVMKDGLIQQVDDPLTLYDRPANLFVAGFIGTPPMNIFHGRLESHGEKFLFYGAENENLKLELPREWGKSLGPYIGKKICFGARPEDIGSRQTEGLDSLPVIPSVVDVVEPMGCETYLYLKSGEASFIARVESHMRVDVGDRLELPIMIDKAHVFDAESEQLIV